jgi:hypothetical protein
MGIIALANNPSISRSVVLTLAKQNKPSIRKMITYNPATPDDVLQPPQKIPIKTFAVMLQFRGSGGLKLSIRIVARTA